MRIAGALELVLLQRFVCKSRGLLLGLSLVAWERSPRIVLGFHLSNPQISLNRVEIAATWQRLLLDLA